MLLQTSAKYLWCPVTSHSLLLETLRSNDADGNENVKKKKQKKKTKNTSHVHQTFLYISLSLLHDYDARSPISRFMEDVNKQRQNFLSLSELGYQLLEIQLQEGSTGYIQFDKVNISG